MRLNPVRRRGVASVIGTILFVVVLMAALGALAYVSSLQAQSSQAAQQAQQLLNLHGRESLTFQALSGGTLAVANSGSSGSTIRYVILKFANGSIYQSAPNQSVGSGSLLSVPSLIPSQNCGLSTCLSKYSAILNSTNAGDSVGVVTFLGNVFWEKPALAVQASTPGTTVQMTFTAIGDSAFASNPVLVVDGMSYTQAQLPVTTTWFVGTKHTFAWQSLPQGTGTRVGATVTGLAQTQSGTITATSAGSIAATFTTQYLLTLTGGSGVTVNPSSPTGDGYYPTGTGVQITAPNVWNLVAGQSRSNLVSYSLDSGSPTSITRSGSGNFVYSLTMNNPHTIAFNSVTQYDVTLQNSVPSTGTLPEIQTSFSYIGPITNSQMLSNPSLSGSLSPWGTASYCSGTCGTYGTSYSGGAYLQGSCNIAYNSGQYSCNDYGQVYQTLINPPSGATYTSMTFSATFSVGNYLAGGSGYGVGNAAFCIWISTQGSSCQVTGTSSGTISTTWTGSTTSVPAVYAEAYANAVTYGSGGYAYGVMWATVTSTSWSITYTAQQSGTSTSATQASDSVSGNTVTYTYTVGYNFPSGSSSTSWSATVPSTESYSSNNCSGASVSGNTVTGTSSATCTVSATRTGTYSSSMTSPTGDGWFDSGSIATISASTSGPFAFSSWSSSSSSQLQIASSTSASTTVTVNTYGTLTANFNVNQ